MPVDAIQGWAFFSALSFFNRANCQRPKICAEPERAALHRCINRLSADFMVNPILHEGTRRTDDGKRLLRGLGELRASRLGVSISVLSASHQRFKGPLGNPEGHEVHEGKTVGQRVRMRLLDRERALHPCRLLSWRWRTLQGRLGFSFA